MLQKRKRKRTARTVARAADDGRLLEEVAVEENLSLGASERVAAIAPTTDGNARPTTTTENMRGVAFASARCDARFHDLAALRAQAPDFYMYGCPRSRKMFSSGLIA